MDHCQTQVVSTATEELNMGDYLSATRMLTNDMRKDPNNPEHYFERSICHYKLGDYQASLNDANTAIRLNSTDYYIHYQKGLALLGLSMFSEAVISFKKAIELRARQDDSKLSDIFNLLRDAMNEFKTARRRPGLPNPVPMQATNQSTSNTISAQMGQQGTSADPVDSTTDRPPNGNTSLVATNRNIQPISNSSHGILTGHNEQPTGVIVHQRQTTNSNPSSINSGRGVATKRLHDTSSQAGSDIDVDDTYNSSMITGSGPIDSTGACKRVMIAPSSSMPATSPAPSASTSKDDSYSSKYKRLRRDRERARRGTSKLCTIKLSDLEELQKPSDTSKRFMRVIAPIDGWLYSGQLSVDDTSNINNTGAPQYAVKLDGDSTGSSYLFSQDTVLTDVIQEVRVKSVSELRKGARICCYWSRQYKCLSTGVVTSRTFEATKSLVSVKYDNGDLSALPLEDLRLLPPDYPKYMSNCDPLLLARNRDGPQITVSRDGPEITTNRDDSEITTNRDGPEITAAQQQEFTNNVEAAEDNERPTERDDEAIPRRIPPTDEIIDFITSETNLNQQDENQHDSAAHNVERVSITKDNITNEANCASSEENNYGIEYCPWMFDGPPRRSKRHGRTYRDNYSSIRRGNEVIRVGDSAELMPRDESILPFIAKIDGLWATGRGEMRVRVRWYYRLIETEGEPYELKNGENALFETDHFDENDVQSIYRSTKILSWTDYSKNNLGHVKKNNDNTPKIFYLAGYYDPVRRVKHLRSDVKEAQ